MAAVLGLPPYLQFFDSNGDPLSGGKIYTYSAGTTTPKATYTDSTGSIAADNPIDLDASGIPDTANGSMWLIGSYKFVVKDSLGNTIRTTDNVTSFSTLANAAEAFFQSFSGDGTTTAFTLSDDLGTEEKALMIFVNKGLQSCVTNGTFATDTDWTKGAGWTIAAGVATATGAISTAISQTSPVTFVQGQAYRVTYTITRSAGGLIPSIGGTSGVERTASGTYNEVIIAGSSQTTAFTGNAFTGTLDNVSINIAAPAGFDILAPTAFTVNGTALTFTTAPATGTNNIYVFAPSLLLGAASAAANAAEASATAALASQISANDSAMSAGAYAQAKVRWTFSSTTAMADPSTGNIRLNNATIASATAIAISDLSADSGNPDLTGWINTWDNGSGSDRGTIYIFKDNENFALFSVNSSNVDNTTWNQIGVTYLAGQGTFTNLDTLYIGFAASGQTTVTGGITDLTGDVTASGSGSVSATIPADSISASKIGTDASAIRTKIGLETLTYPLMNYGGMNFDGSTDYLDTNPLTGIADGKKGSIVAILRYANASSGTEQIIQGIGATVQVRRNAAGTIEIAAENAAGSVIMSVTSAVGAASAAGQYIIMASWDLATAGSGRLYINDASSYIETTFTNDTIDYTVAEYSLGGNTAGASLFTGDFYTLWFDATNNLNFATESVRRKFVDVNGVPVYLGANGELPTGTSPILFLGNNSGTDWANNRGTATSSFTVNGTPIAATTALSGQYGVLNGLTSSTAQASTSGTAINFTSIPSTVNQIIVTLSGVSTSGTSVPIIQLGDSGGYEATGYISEVNIAGTGGSSTVGFPLSAGTQSAAFAISGSLTLTRITGQTWIAAGVITYGAVGSGFLTVVAGSKTTSTTTDRLRVTTTGGTDTFDAGTINIAYI